MGNLDTENESPELQGNIVLSVLRFLKHISISRKNSEQIMVVVYISWKVKILIISIFSFVKIFAIGMDTIGSNTAISIEDVDSKSKSR